jgi:hypothetical protein
MFCEPRLIFGGTEGVGSRFHVLRSRTRFRRYRGRRVPFSCVGRLDSFSAESRVSGPVYMFCATDSFSAVPRVYGPVFVFCALELIFDGSDVDVSRFLVLRTRTHLRLFRGRRVSFSCFMLRESFSALPRASGPIFMFCTPRLIFSGTERVRSCLHVLRCRTRFRRCRVCRVPFSCFARPD